MRFRQNEGVLDSNWEDEQGRCSPRYCTINYRNDVFSQKSRQDVLALSWRMQSYAQCKH